MEALSMKKIIQIFFLIIACSVGVLTSCHTKNSKAEIKFMFDDKGNYTGFSNLPKEETVEAYEKKGYYVTQDSEVIANQEVWERFIETAKSDNNTVMRMVSLYTQEDIKVLFIGICYTLMVIITYLIVVLRI